MKVTITQQEKINKFLLSGLQNLRSGLDGLNLENFVVNTLEVLMHLERDEYLEEIKKIDFKTVCGLKIFMGSSTGDMLVDNQATLENIFSNVNNIIYMRNPGILCVLLIINSV